MKVMVSDVKESDVIVSSNLNMVLLLFGIWKLKYRFYGKNSVLMSRVLVVKLWMILCCWVLLLFRFMMFFGN